MNMVPWDIKNELQSDIGPNNINFLAPNEILDGNSLSVYTITNPNYVHQRLENINEKSRKEQLSLIEKFALGMRKVEAKGKKGEEGYEKTIDDFGLVLETFGEG